MFEAILQYFEENIDKLSLIKQIHFLQRLYRISGMPKYLIRLNELIPGELDLVKHFEEILRNDDESVLIWGQRAADRFKPIKPNDLGKKEIYTREPRMLFYFRLLWLLYDLTVMKVEFDFEFALLQKRIKDVQHLLLEDEYIRKVTVKTCNSVFAMKEILKIDVIDEYKQTFKRVFFQEATYYGILLTNKFYGCTHLIINSSGFYHKTVPELRNEFYSVFLIEELAHILRSESIDLIIEVVICLFLLGIKDQEVYRSVEMRIKKESSKTGSFILLDNCKNINVLEHQNILALMLLKIYEDEFSSFHQF